MTIENPKDSFNTKQTKSISDKTALNTLTKKQMDMLSWCIDEAEAWRGGIDVEDIDEHEKQIDIARQALAKIKRNNTLIKKSNSNKNN